MQNNDNARAHGHFTVECVNPDGSIAWTEPFCNLVTTGGKNDALDKYFQGSSYTAAWYMGLIGSTGYTTGPAAGDTMSSHAGWAEETAYDQTARVAPTWDAAASGSKATQTVSFSMNADKTIKGVFLCTNAVKGNSAGVLYSAGTFSGGDRAVTAGQVLNIVWTGGL